MPRVRKSDFVHTKWFVSSWLGKSRRSRQRKSSTTPLKIITTYFWVELFTLMILFLRYFFALYLKLCYNMNIFDILSTTLTPGGGTWIWKWRTSAYRRTKIGGIRCKISSKKGVIRCGHQKTGFFWCGLPKMGVIQYAKMQFQGKICKFSVKIAKNVHFLCKIWFKSGKKGVIGCEPNKKRGHWV